jgi:hypothetical protein
MAPRLFHKPRGPWPSITRTTEVVYHRELRPVLTTGAEVMDTIFNPQISKQANRGSDKQLAARTQSFADIDDPLY